MVNIKPGILAGLSALVIGCGNDDSALEFARRTQDWETYELIEERSSPLDRTIDSPNYPGRRYILREADEQTYRENGLVFVYCTDTKDGGRECLFDVGKSHGHKR